MKHANKSQPKRKASARLTPPELIPFADFLNEPERHINRSGELIVVFDDAARGRYTEKAYAAGVKNTKYAPLLAEFGIAAVFRRLASNWPACRTWTSERLSQETGANTMVKVTDLRGGSHLR